VKLETRLSQQNGVTDLLNGTTNTNNNLQRPLSAAVMTTVTLLS